MPARDAFFFIVLKLLIHVHCAGGWVGLGHPQDPGRQPYPSFWASDYMVFFLQAIDGQTINLHQCMYGAPSVKPTTIASDDPHLRRLTCGCNHIVPHARLIGLDGSGKFRTRPAARYPPDLCAAFAKVFVERWLSVVANGGRAPIDVPGVPWSQQLFPPVLVSQLMLKSKSQSYPQQ